MRVDPPDLEDLCLDLCGRVCVQVNLVDDAEIPAAFGLVDGIVVSAELLHVAAAEVAVGERLDLARDHLLRVAVELSQLRARLA